MNRYEWKDGKLHHYINDELRAVVPHFALTDYRAFYPDAPDEVAAQA